MLSLEAYRIGTRKGPSGLPPSLPPSLGATLHTHDQREEWTHWTQKGLHKVKYNKMFNEQILISKYETATERRSGTEITGWGSGKG